MLTQTVVFYHSPCADGFTAAWAMRRAHLECQFIPVKHGDPLGNLKDRLVYFLDFCPKRLIMDEVIKQAQQVTILDHHKSAIEDMQGIDKKAVTHFDVNRSGARIAWDFFHFNVPPPLLVQYVEDRDLWKNEMPSSEEINAFIFSKEQTFENWDQLHLQLKDPVCYDHIRRAGAAMIDKQKQDIKALLEFKFRAVIDGHKVWAINLPYIYASDVGAALAKDEPFAAIFNIQADNDVKVSLRSDSNGLDVSEIAVKFGGGGHRHAAAFNLKVPPLTFTLEAV